MSNTKSRSFHRAAVSGRRVQSAEQPGPAPRTWSWELDRLQDACTAPWGRRSTTGWVLLQRQRQQERHMTMLFFLFFFFNKKQNIARRKTFHISTHYGLPSLLHFCFVAFPDLTSSVFLVKRARASSGSVSGPTIPRQEPPPCWPRTRCSVNGRRM